MFSNTMEPNPESRDESSNDATRFLEEFLESAPLDNPVPAAPEVDQLMSLADLTMSAYQGVPSLMEELQTMTVSIDIQISHQPALSCRARYPNEIADFQSRGSGGTCGSRLTGRGGPKSHLTVSLMSRNGPVSGRLIGLPVDCNCETLHKLHLYHLIGSCCDSGVYMEQVELLPGVAKDFMLSKMGIVIAKKKDIGGECFNRTGLLKNFYDDPRMRPLFDQSMSGTLLVDPMSAPDGKFRIFFTFIPDQLGVSIPWLTTEPISCQTGAAGGKCHLEVKEMNPKCVQLDPIGNNAWQPREDVWLHLDTALKVKTESVSAQIFLQDSQYYPGIDVETEVAKGNDLVKLRLTRLASGLRATAALPSSERFQAAIRLTKLSSMANGANATRETVKITVTFECSASVKRKRAERHEFEEMSSIMFPNVRV